MKKLMLALFCLAWVDVVAAEQRIISAGSGVTELLFALEKQQSLIAVDVTSRSPRVKDLPVVGYHRQLSAEGLLSLAPDMLIGSEEMGPKSTLNLLKSSGVEVVILPTEASMDSLIQRVDLLGEKLNRTAQANSLKQQISQSLIELENHNAKLAIRKKVIFLLLNDKGSYTAAGGNTTAHTLMALAGAENPAQELNSYQPLSVEAFLSMQPDAIVVSGRQWRKYQDLDTLFAAMPLLAETPAGKKRAVYVIDGSALVGGLGLSSLTQAAKLQQQLYPL